MASPQTFDLARSTYDSWPWMFGVQWDRISQIAMSGGIEAAAPQVHMLVLWCSGLEDQALVDQTLARINGMTARNVSTGRDEPVAHYVKLQHLLAFCIKIAKDSAAWNFNKQPEKRLPQTKEALLVNGRALP